MPFARALTTLIDAVLPARCPLTGAIVAAPGLVVPEVWRDLDFIASPLCACCGLRFDLPVEDGTHCPTCLAKPPDFDCARSVLAYDDISREMILSFKHGDKTHLTATFIPWLHRVAQELITPQTIIVPVPLHWTRMLARRYNQAGLLAQALAKTLNRPYRPDALARRRATPSQGHLTRAQRHDNVATAFVAPKPMTNLDILLIDDVYTTGATLNACAKTLKKAGAQHVTALTLARALPNRPI